MYALDVQIRAKGIPDTGSSMRESVEEGKGGSDGVFNAPKGRGQGTEVGPVWEGCGSH